MNISIPGKHNLITTNFILLDFEYMDAYIINYILLALDDIVYAFFGYLALYKHILLTGEIWFTSSGYGSRY